MNHEVHEGHEVFFDRITHAPNYGIGLFGTGPAPLNHFVIWTMGQAGFRRIYLGWLGVFA